MSHDHISPSVFVADLRIRRLLFVRQEMNTSILSIVSSLQSSGALFRPSDYSKLIRSYNGVEKLSPVRARVREEQIFFLRFLRAVISGFYLIAIDSRKEWRTRNRDTIFKDEHGCSAYISIKILRAEKKTIDLSRDRFSCRFAMRRKSRITRKFARESRDNTTVYHVVKNTAGLIHGCSNWIYIHRDSRGVRFIRDTRALVHG